MAATRRFVPRIEALESRLVMASNAFVQALYADLLHRPARPEELTAWNGVLAAGVSPLRVALAFSQSPEYQSNEVRLDYLVLLDRPPTPLESAAWLRSLQAGLSEEQMEVGFLSSPEYFQLHNSTALGWLSGIYQDVLDQAPSAMAQQQALNLDVQSMVIRDMTALGVVHSPLAHARVITDIYEQLLNRNPDVPAAIGFVQQLDQGTPPSMVVAEIASSAEFIGLANEGQYNNVSGIPPGSPPVLTPLGSNPALGTSLGGNSLYEALPFLVPPQLVV